MTGRMYKFKPEIVWYTYGCDILITSKTTNLFLHDIYTYIQMLLKSWVNTEIVAGIIEWSNSQSSDAQSCLTRGTGIRLFSASLTSLIRLGAQRTRQLYLQTS